MRIGVISDTHGLIRPEALTALAGSELIIHAGDVGDPAVLVKLRTIAPVIVVRGNIDKGDWADRLPGYELVRREGASIYVIHDVSRLEVDPVAAGLQAVISGHTHKPAARVQDGVLYLNPGSAGPRRFKLPVALALLDVSEKGLHAEHIHLVA